MPVITLSISLWHIVFLILDIFCYNNTFKVRKPNVFMSLLKNLAVGIGASLGALALSDDAEACHTCRPKPHVSSHTTVSRTRVHEGYHFRTAVTRTVDRRVDGYGHRSRHVSVDVRRTPRPVYAVPVPVAVPITVPVAVPVYGASRPIFGIGIHHRPSVIYTPSVVVPIRIPHHPIPSGHHHHHFRH